MDDVRRHGGHGNGCGLAGSKNNSMRQNWKQILLLFIVVSTYVIACIIDQRRHHKHDAPAINYEAVLSRKSDSLERVVQQLQECKEDLLRQDTIIMDQRSYIEQLEGLKKARPPNR